jgi:hypothetical protein
VCSPEALNFNGSFGGTSVFETIHLLFKKWKVDHIIVECWKLGARSIGLLGNRLY